MNELPTVNVAGKALMKMKGSFSDVANVLLDWDDVHNGDFCSWRGIVCDNFSLSVASLLVSVLNSPSSVAFSIY